MKRCIAGICAGLVLGMGSNLGVSAPLPPEHEVRRLMIAVEEAVDQDDWEAASRHLNRLQNLEAGKPDNYQFFRGQVMLEAGQVAEARSALENYVTSAGAEGEYYDQALQLITRLEEEGAAPDEATSEPVAVIEPTERVDVAALQQLYLESSRQGALTAHLNSLLSQSAWQPGPIIQREPEESLEYQVEIREDGTLQIRETARQPDQGPTIRTLRLPVFGINPAIDYACLATENSCWLYDPRDSSRWLRLANRPATAEEVSQVMGELIRTLQKGEGA